MTLEAIREIRVPSHVVDATDAALRAAGGDRAECFVLWTGVAAGVTFEVRTAHVPRQKAYRFESGVCVRVEGPELHKLNVWLYEHVEQLAVQIHSHPEEAYHSDTDDTYPIVTVRGGMSIVVPNFGRDGLGGGGLAYYRLDDLGWAELADDEATQLVRLDS